MDLVPLLLLLIVIALIVTSLVARLMGTTTIHDYERGLRFVRGCACSLGIAQLAQP